MKRSQFAQNFTRIIMVQIFFQNYKLKFSPKMGHFVFLKLINNTAETTGLIDAIVVSKEVQEVLLHSPTKF